MKVVIRLRELLQTCRRTRHRNENTRRDGYRAAHHRRDDEEFRHVRLYRPWAAWRPSFGRCEADPQSLPGALLGRAREHFWELLASCRESEFLPGHAGIVRMARCGLRHVRR